MTLTATVTFDDWGMAALYLAGLLAACGVVGGLILSLCRVSSEADRRLDAARKAVKP